MYPRHLPANKRSNFICALLTALFIGSCAGPIAPPTSRLIGTDVTHVYRLGVGDKLKITVYGEKELSGEFEVGALGTVSMPLIGDVRARGRTIRVFRDQIRQRLAQGYLNDPRVNVDVMNYRAYFVQGEVRKPGEFTFKNGLTVRDAIAAASQAIVFSPA